MLPWIFDYRLAILLLPRLVAMTAFLDGVSLVATIASSEGVYLFGTFDFVAVMILGILDMVSVPIVDKRQAQNEVARKPEFGLSLKYFYYHRDDER